MKMMKKMNYQKTRNIEILHKGNHKGFDFFIASLGTHPCSYVKIPKKHKYYNKYYDKIEINCHGGLTFASDDFMFNPIVVEDSWWIGWDYAHFRDFVGFMENDGNHEKKWTTEEIFEEIKEVIKQLIEVLDDEKDN